jgi:hypothetical protein
MWSARLGRCPCRSTGPTRDVAGRRPTTNATRPLYQTRHQDCPHCDGRELTGAARCRSGVGRAQHRSPGGVNLVRPPFPDPRSIVWSLPASARTMTDRHDKTGIPPTMAACLAVGSPGGGPIVFPTLERVGGTIRSRRAGPDPPIRLRDAGRGTTPRARPRPASTTIQMARSCVSTGERARGLLAEAISPGDRGPATALRVAGPLHVRSG